MKGGAGDNEIGKEGDREKRFPAPYEHDVAIDLFFFFFLFFFLFRLSNAPFMSCHHHR